jgi:DNA-binding transcriptional LysR family regulator
MDDLRRLAIFAAVVEHRSLSAAARALGTSPSAVSQQVRLLERTAGVTLLHRTTRKLSLTAAGERLAVDCAALVGAAQRARAQLALSRDAPVGELRLSATVGFARHVAPALGDLLAGYPGLTLKLLVDDAQIDLVHARVDLALRLGRMPDSSWSARRLCAFEIVLCAAPSYLDRHGEPQHPDELSIHQLLCFERQGRTVPWRLRGPQAQPHTVQDAARIGSNNQLSLQQMCVAGLGLAQLGRVDVASDLRAGRLVTVLPAWTSESLPVWAVTPQRDAQPAKVRHAVQALQAYLLTLPGVQP